MQMNPTGKLKLWLRSCLVLASFFICGLQAEKTLAEPNKTEANRQQSGPAKMQFKSLKDDNSLVSIVALIANPATFHKREVEFVAYLNLEFEGDALYLSPTDAKYGVTPNAISLNDSSTCRRSGGNLKYVLVRGEFVADKGLKGMYAGTINRPIICQPWSVSAEAE